MAKFEIIIDDKQFKRDIERLRYVTGGNHKELRKMLRRAAKPWPEVANSAVYRYVKRETGGMGKAIGIATFVSPQRGEVGVKARPKPKGPNSGWRAHFFATPARQIRRSKRIPWSRLYATKDGEVIANVVTGFRAIIKKVFK